MSVKSVFNPATFLQTSVTGANSTEIPQLPPADYDFQIVNVPAPKLFEGKDGKEDSIIWKIGCKCLNPPEDGVTYGNMNYDVFLDILPNGALDLSEGKNVNLGRLRAAINQNSAEEEWNPLNMMGQIFVGKVTQKPDKDNPERMYSRIVDVSPKI